MEQGKGRARWRLFLAVVVVGIAVGAVYYFGMRQRAAPTDFVSFISPDDMSVPLESAPILQLESALNVPNADYPRLSIPTAGVSALIVQLQITGNTWGVYGLGRNVGHLVGTSPLMGQGNTVLVGHVEMADGSLGVFSRIPNMRAGEPIYLNWRGEERVYNVSTVRTVSPDDVSVLYPSDEEKLTLITCSDFSFIDNTYLNRVVVVASRVS